MSTTERSRCFVITAYIFKAAFSTYIYRYIVVTAKFAVFYFCRRFLRLRIIHKLSVAPFDFNRLGRYSVIKFVFLREPADCYDYFVKSCVSYFRNHAVAILYSNSYFFRGNSCAAVGHRYFNIRLNFVPVVFFLCFVVCKYYFVVIIHRHYRKFERFNGVFSVIERYRIISVLAYRFNLIGARN